MKKVTNRTASSVLFKILFMDKEETYAIHKRGQKFILNIAEMFPV